MSVIISLFVLVYLAAIVLASILSVIWIVTLFISVKDKGFYRTIAPVSNSSLMRLFNH